MPDATASEAVHDADAEALRGMSGLDELLGSTLTNSFGIAITVDVTGKDLLVARVDVVTHGLTDEVGRDGVALHAGGLQLGAFGIAVSLVGFLDFKVISPAGELEAVIAKAFAFLKHGVEGQIGPLAGEEGDGTWHGLSGVG